MRKCFSCGETKSLKSIFVEDCDCHFDKLNIGDPVNHSVCKVCFFDHGAIEMDGPEVSECLEDSNGEYYEKANSYNENWNGYDYHWNLKK